MNRCLHNYICLLTKRYIYKNKRSLPVSMLLRQQLKRRKTKHKMVLVLNITSEYWALVENINVESFNDFIKTYISGFLNNFIEIEKTVIHLPIEVTKAQRYSLHRISNSEFKAESYNKENERFMTLTLSKYYVRELFINYVFPEPENLSEKQILLNTILDFINKNLADEFKTYLNTI